MSKTKTSICVIAATALTVMTLFLLPFAPKLAVRTAIISRGDLMKTTLLEGAVAYENEQPILSAQMGRISAVYVKQGQEVKAGQLLFSMDTALEQQALSMLTSRRYAAEKATVNYGEAVTAAVNGAALSWEERELSLRQVIEAKQVRAFRDGVVGAVYQREGDYVSTGAVLGMVHSAELCVVAAWQPGVYAQAESGAAATVATSSEESAIYARLERMSAPSLDSETNQYIQQLTFLPAAEETLNDFELGERVMVEMLNQTSLNVPLVPVEAIGENNRLWVVRDGLATSVKVEIGQRNERYASVPESLLGQQIILLPDESKLTEGCAVKEAKRR